MTLSFNENIINDGDISAENFKNANFIGYLNKNGDIVDYSISKGHGINYITDLFSYIINMRLREEANNGNTENSLESVNRLLKINELQINNHEQVNVEDLIYRDILIFFKNCFSNNTFNNGLGKNFYLKSKEQFEKEDYYLIYQNCLKLYPKTETETEEQYKNRISNLYQLNSQYKKYRKTELSDLLKEVIISYLGYHSIERVPRTITTSSFKIYETFYNYLLNDFTIYQMPKMIYDEDKKMYVMNKQNEFFIPDSELRLKEEIQSIKKLVPKKERYKYYR